MSRHTRIRLTAVAALHLVGAVPLLGQSLYNSAGLGLPIEALDGRARSLGNLGVGLSGGSFLATDPGGLGRLSASTGVMATQPSWVDFSTEAGQSGSFEGNRFPLLGIAYPIFDGMMAIQIGSFLDQSYTSSSANSIDLASGPLATTDEFVQDGSVSNINFGFARMFGEKVSIGMTVGRYAGSVDRTLTRKFGEEDDTDIDPYVERGVWSYSGYSLTTGASADVTSSLRVAASIQVPTKLDAAASDETRGADRSYDLPIYYRLGATASLGPAITVTGSAQLADWSKTQSALSAGVKAGAANGFGVGLELTRARLWGKDAPLRFGFRRTGLPFSPGDRSATERIFSGGLGLDLNTTNGIVLAALHLAAERGRRSGAGFSENFWRMTISLLAASGF